MHRKVKRCNEAKYFDKLDPRDAIEKSQDEPIRLVMTGEEEGT